MAALQRSADRDSDLAALREWLDALRAAAPAGSAMAAAPAAPAAYDVSVAPGESVQAAVDRCPAGGAVLLRPGVHRGPVVIAGRGVGGCTGRAGPRWRTAGTTGPRCCWPPLRVRAA